MRLTYYGHSAFLVETSDGTRIILDPYRSGSYGGALAYGPIRDPADVVVSSHEHDDHGAVDTIPGNPVVLVHPTSAAAGAATITGIPVYHDESGGRERGRNTVIVIQDGDLRLVHLGDLGHRLDRSTLDKLGRVDVLLIPVGGFYTIGPDDAAATVEFIAPKVVIPMHYSTERCSFPIEPVEGFVSRQAHVQRMGTSTLEITVASLPAEQTTFVLDYSR